MSYQELQSHKKSDSIKWIIVFVLIFILFAGLTVTLFRDNKEETPEETKTEQSAELEGQEAFDGEIDNLLKE